MSESTSPISHVLRTVGSLTGGILLSAFILYILSGVLFDGLLLSIVRLLAFALAGFGLVAWNLPLKPVYLTGEADEWHTLLGWDGRTIGYVKAGPAMIKPIQRTRRWLRVNPMFVKHDTQAQNRLLDTFDIHIRVSFDIYPSQARHANARWLMDVYPDGLMGMIRGTLNDIAKAELRGLDSFSRVVESQTEDSIKAAVNDKFGWLADKGVYLNAGATFVDVMVAADLLVKRTKARAELSTLQLIRDVAHDMGMTTDELLLQRALERLPDTRTARVNVSEIAGVLQALRAQKPRQLEAPHVSEAVLQPDIEEPTGPTYTPPSSYVEGYYQVIDPNDPDDTDGPKGIYSPF